MMNRSLNLLCATAFLALSACGGPASDESPPLQGARMGGAFELTGENGKPVKEADFAGQYRLVYFGYTFCPDVCPVDMQRLMQGFKALEADDKAVADKIQPLFITVDPKRDTPQALTEFTNAFHPRLLGLTGTEAQVDDVLARYGSYAERDKPNAEGGYLVNHSNNAVLYGPKGEPLAIIAHEGEPKDIAAELARWVK
jgi:protein SCO1